jgi:Late embryogenesis abundant protein
MKTHVSFWAGLCLLLVLGVGCAAPKELVFNGVSKFAINRDNDDEKLRIQMTAAVENPNNFRIKVLDYNLDLYINGAKVGRVESKENRLLRKKCQSEVPFSVDTSVGGLFSGLGAVLMGLGKPDLQIRLVGDVKACGSVSVSGGPTRHFERSEAK